MVNVWPNDRHHDRHDAVHRVYVLLNVIEFVEAKFRRLKGQMGAK